MVTVNSSGKKGFPEVLTSLFVLAMLYVALAFPAWAQAPEIEKAGAFDQEPATESTVHERKAALRGPATTQSLLNPDAAPESDPEKQKLSAFFLIGIVINIVLLLVVGTWAYREWRRPE